MLALFLGACAHGPKPAPGPTEPPPLTVAVIEFGDSGRDAENGCVMAVLEAGLRVIGRDVLAQKLPNDDSIDYRQLGHTLGADLVIDGGIARGMKVRKPPPARLVSTRSGNLLAVSRMAGRIDKSYKVGQKVCSDLLAQLP
jgi:TolB-like protein